MNSGDISNGGSAARTDPVGGIYDIDEYFATGEETGSIPSGLALTEDGDSVWASFKFHEISGMFLVRTCFPGTPSGNVGTLCRCRVDLGDGDVRMYDGSRPAPCQSVNFLSDGRIQGMIRFSRRREDFRRIEGRRVGGEEAGGWPSAEEMRKRWEELGAECQ